MLWKLKQRQQKWLQGEKGTVVKDWGGKVRVALAFPNRYAVGMSNLGFQFVYETLNRFEDIVCERVFYPEPEDIAVLRRFPGNLLSVETQQPLRDFHMVAFSVPFENDYTNVLEMLSLGGLPARAEERTEAHPLVSAGGVALFLNPEPLAPFLDFIFAGEAEALLPGFIEFWREFENSSFSRTEILTRLGKSVSGIYVPSLYEPHFKADGTLEGFAPLAGSGLPERVSYHRADLEKTQPCRTAVLTPNTEFSNVLLLEIGRGCGRGCRFCAAGFVYRPIRHHDAEKLIDTAAAETMPDTNRIGLVSAAVSDHPEINYLCDSLLDKGGSLSFSSLRADTLSPEILSALESSDHQAVAIAPEAGSERLRRVINKHLTEEQIYRAAEILAEKGILNIKLYFMIGLPTETLDDLQAIVDIAKGIRHHVLNISRGKTRLGTITLSVNSFVPKPFTPFQWVPFAGVRELRDKAKWIQKALQKVPNVRVHFDLPKWAYIQALLSRGDRRVSHFIEQVALDGLSWTQALRNAPLNPDFWIMREREKDEKFPWEIIDHGIDRRFLWDEYQRALQAKDSPECRLERNCRRCGVCAP